MSRPREADDFATIRARLDELRRERRPQADRSTAPASARPADPRDEIERRHRDRREGRPPPWAPTIFVSRPG